MPCRQIFITDEALVDVFVVVHRILRNFDLCVRAGQKIHMLAFWQGNDEFFDKCGDILVGYYLTFPFLYTEYRFGDNEFHIVFDLHLTAKMPVVHQFLAGKMHFLSRQSFASSFGNAYTALSAAATSATC